jgi:uncharacterized membrane protein YqaE (UPF0057 family)
MRFFRAIVCPPLAVLLCGTPLQTLLNLFLTLCLWVPGAVHTCLVVNAHLADKRNARLVRAVRRPA